MYERLYSYVHPDNYELIRKLSWTISNAFYKKSLISHSTLSFQAAFREVNHAAEYLKQYENFTKKLERCPILSRTRYLESNPFLDKADVEEHRLRIQSQRETLWS